jgi:NADP-dependent 3-hydroxy acid dehydrogenase YdfG
MSVAVVTGAASGFGRALTERLLARSWTVFASDEQPPSAWAAGLPGDLRAAQVDVRSDAQVEAAMAGLPPVDLLVNNAGYAVFGAADEVPVDLVRDLFDVNVLGVVRVTRAVLPRVRDAHGAVVQISSIAGRTVFPESGFYAATKYAVEGLSEALHQETVTFGVRVRVIEPGSFDTGFLPTAAARSPSPPAHSAYAAVRPTWTQRKFALLEAPQDRALVVDAILGSLDDPRPFLRVRVGPDAERILAARDLLGPDGWSTLAGERAGGALPTAADVRGWPPEARDRHRRLHALRHLDHWPAELVDALFA